MAAMNRITGLVSMLALSGACYSGSDAPIGAGADMRNVDLNGPVLNGPIVQGPIVQGAVIQGIILNGPIVQGPIVQGPIVQGPIVQSPVLQGVQVNGPIVQGPIVQGPIVQGTVFSGVVLENGEEVPISGEDFIGSEWDLRLAQLDEEGNEEIEEFVLRIDDMYAAEEDEDVFLYDVVYRPKSGGNWTSICPNGTPEGAPAMPLTGYWNLETGDRVDDPNVFVFACTNAVLAKCVLWGYKPWDTSTKCTGKGKNKKCEQVSLAPYHQTCTRMARADYCGDGTPWTVDGTAIDVRDILDPPVQFETTDWKIEAEWNPDGAYCLDDLRNQALKDQGLWPTCFLNNKGKKIKTGDCGSLKNDRALMYSTHDNGQGDDDDDHHGHHHDHGNHHGNGNDHGHGGHNHHGHNHHGH